MGIITAGAFHSGTTDNVIPETAELKLTIPALRPPMRRSHELVQAQAAVYGASASIHDERRYPVLVNHADATAFARQVAVDWVAAAGIIPDQLPLTGSEDFAFFLQQCKGSDLLLGNGVGHGAGAGGCMVHNPGGDFNDRCLGPGASDSVRLVQALLV
jgi:hippurate hydrolase